MQTTKHEKTIAQLFKEFLADQKPRISRKTYTKYEEIIDLYGSYLESYWPGHDGEYGKAGGTYCDTYGPEDATAGYGMFLSYFMPRKVMCGKETMKAAGSVTKKLAEWLAEKGYVKNTEEAQERAEEAAKDLPNASTVVDLLEALSMKPHQPGRARSLRTISTLRRSSLANSGSCRSRRVIR
jgi:hypothetical protein